MTSFARSLGRTLIEDTAKRGRPMNDGESELFIMLALMAEGRFGTPDAAQGMHEDAMKQSLVYAILCRRIEVTTGARVDIPSLLFLAQLADGRPGKAVLLAAVIAEISDDGKKDVTFTDVVDAFPFNVPNEDVFESAWLLQKSKEYNGQYFDNALDAKWAWDTEIEISF